ncbi:MAG: DUF2911 domain-containing protein [Bacteroidota bacterium]
MKLYLLIVLIIGSTNLTIAQFRGLDASPMDAAYLPDNFAHDRDPGEKAVIKIYYSRPQVKGREIFGSKVPYDKVWRLGANENTELTAYQDITIGGKALKAGTYSLFAIPTEKEWTIIVSSAVDYWGAYSYDEKNDVLRFTVPVNSLPDVVEAFSIKCEETGEGKGVMRIGWEKTMVEVPIEY